MPVKNLKSKIVNFLIASASTACLFTLAKLAKKNKSNKRKKQLNQKNLQKELEKFVKDNGISSENLDSEKFKSNFMRYLRDNNYDCEGMEMQTNIENLEDANEESGEQKKLPRNIQKISEDLNDCINGMEIFSHTLNMTPGLVCYTIEKIAPNDKKPYVTYRPTPRVITQVHKNGVNGGTIFLTYSHKLTKSSDFNGQKTARVVSEDEALYTPLTKEHALYVCKILNAQSRIFYMQQIKKQQKIK